MSTIPGGVNGLSHIRTGIAASGIATKFIGMAHAHPTHSHGIKVPGGANSLYVSDAGINAVDVLANNSWTYSGSITSGINGPDGNWVDKKAIFTLPITAVRTSRSTTRREILSLRTAAA